MSTEAEEEVAVAAGNMCCASCGTAAVDDIKLKNCDGGCDLVKYCSDTCEANHRPSMKRCARKDWQSYVMIIYSPSQMKAISESARFVACLCRLIHQNPRSCHAAANIFAMDAIMPIRCVSMKQDWSQDVHSVESPLQNPKKNLIRGL
jgi:hypothetical protein